MKRNLFLNCFAPSHAKGRWGGAKGGPLLLHLMARGSILVHHWMGGAVGAPAEEEDEGASPALRHGGDRTRAPPGNTAFVKITPNYQILNSTLQIETIQIKLWALMGSTGEGGRKGATTTIQQIGGKFAGEV